MNIKEFTDAEMASLLSSEYVVQVTSQFVYFSGGFKQQFYREYQAGKKPKKIIESMGIDPDILGQSRINGIKCHIFQDLRTGKGFTEITSENAAAQTGKPLTPEVKIRRLEHELAYTKQELEFVKKLLPVAGRKKNDLCGHSSRDKVWYHS